MGLQGSITDISGDSIPLLLLSLVAAGVGYLHSLLETLGLVRVESDELAPEDGRRPPGGSGLAGLILLADQLNLNRASSFRRGGGASDCVVCMCGMEEGEQVRMLPCRHVFHKDCLDGWLECRNFTCPLCRSPLAPGQRVPETDRRVDASAAAAWFGVR